MPSEDTQFKKGNKFGKPNIKKGDKIALGKHYKLAKGVRSGKNHWNWQGGISPLENRIRYSYKYRQWRSDVFTRDNFICQDCGYEKGRILEAHHIKSFAQILKENNVKTLDESNDCEELWNINNGITLCKNCHKEKRLDKGF